MTKSSDTGQDLVSRLRPNERLGHGVAVRDVGEDRGLKRAGAPVGPTFNLFVGEQGEPALDEIEPGRAGRGEMEMEAGVAGEPAVNHRRLVRAVVLQNQVHVQFGGYSLGKTLEEGAMGKKPLGGGRRSGAR
jgi:hypothetical protein